MNNVSSRVAQIDAFKGLLIFLVVLGHAIGGLPGYGNGETMISLRLISDGIYFFHMPAFFVVTGFLWKERTGEFSNFLARRIKHLIVPYSVFGIISVVIYAFLVDRSPISILQGCVSLLHGGGWPNGEGFRSNSVLWFLPALFSATLMYWLIDRIVPWHRYKSLHPIIGIICYYIHIYCFVLRGVVCEIPFGIVQALKYVGCIAFGRLAWHTYLHKLDSYKKTDTFLGGVIVWACSFLLIRLLGDLGISSLFGDHSGLILLAERSIMYLLSITASFGCYAIVASLRIKFLESMGINSLGIMLLHKFPIVSIEMFSPISLRCWQFAGGIPMVAFVTGMAVLVSQILSIYIRQNMPIAFGMERN